MDFTIAQRTTLLRTLLLFFYFAISLVCLSSFMYLALVFAKHVVLNRSSLNIHAVAIDYWQPGFFAIVAALSIFVVSIGSLLKFRQLLQGIGPLVELLGGRRASSEIPEEQIFIDIVEELALTSGIPFPVPIVIEKERALNAFALGDVETQAVIGITEGMLVTLTRDELQAVVAHEMAHLIHGDASLGVRMISLLHGMVGITNFGFYLCEVGSGERTLFSKDKPAGKPRQNFLFLMFGLMLSVAGAAGMLAGATVKRLITRGREFGADREACALIGDSEPLVRALAKMTEEENKSYIRNRDAKLCGHMFFADVNKPSLLNKFSTHPSLQRRIKRLEHGVVRKEPLELEQSTRAETVLLKSDRQEQQKAVAIEPEATAVAQAISHLRQPVVGTVQPLKKLLDQVPREIRRALHQPETAVAILYCLFLSSNEKIQASQVEILLETVNDKVKDEMEKAFASLNQLSFSLRFLLLSIAIESLKHLNVDDYQRVRQVVEKLVAIDSEQKQMHVYLLQRMLFRALDSWFEVEQKVDEDSLPSLDDAVLQTMTVAAVLGNARRKVDEAKDALAKALKHLAFEEALDKARLDACNIKMLKDSLDTLSLAPVPVRVSVLEGVGECLAEDGVIDSDEMALMHVLAKDLGIGVPLFLQVPNESVSVQSSTAEIVAAENVVAADGSQNVIEEVSAE